ncbi:hypothetical protein EUGRSUZ_L00074 [Eucalyptus grandis]|uniref:Disease resistance protein At4g27190-like leucine-rich repeats domain-containing protein n=1 Tax=Eucalyptus grandis TaxID=71139 RepID=A0A058ZW51_EUCGR|nr:hypothetical protein EUGRSUZ_L00074 [Eucalyptus grandis]
MRDYFFCYYFTCNSYAYFLVNSIVMGSCGVIHPLQLIRLQNLEAITVERCQLIRVVFDLEELTTSGDVKILWQLTRLTLSGLPKLECIWSKNPRF